MATTAEIVGKIQSTNNIQLEHGVVVLHPLYNLRGSLMTTIERARIAIIEQSSHVGVLFNDCFAQQPILQSQFWLLSKYYLYFF